MAAEQTPPPAPIRYDDSKIGIKSLTNHIDELIYLLDEMHNVACKQNEEDENGDYPYECNCGLLAVEQKVGELFQEIDKL